MKYLIGAACIAIIASSGVYLAGEYNAYAERQVADKMYLDAVVAKAAADRKIQDDMAAWSKARNDAEKRTHVEITDPCFVAVNKLRSIEAATVARVPPLYNDKPDILRTQINACVSRGTYTKAQVSDVLG